MSAGDFDGVIHYRPWVPREGMSGWYKHLARAWGDPNIPRNLDKWNRGVLERVCERGKPIPWVYA